MKRNSQRVSGNPFLAWTDLAWKISEMSLASAEVIAHRTTRMAAAGPMPSARDRKEFHLMGQEKFDAATESARAMAGHFTTMYLQIGARMFRHMVTGSAALVSLATSRNADQFVTRHAKLAATMSRSAITASEMSGSTVRLARHGLKPLHARATANARRLGRR